MKVVIAPDSYKESMSALTAADCIRQGIQEVFPRAECFLAPMADGGEGTAECLMHSQQGEKISCQVMDPLGKTIEADFIWIEKTKTAVIEVAKTCGITLISPEAKNPDIPDEMRLVPLKGKAQDATMENVVGFIDSIMEGAFNKNGEYYGAINLRTMSMLKKILMCEDNDRKDWEDFIKNKMHISTERTDF